MTLQTAIRERISALYREKGVAPALPACTDDLAVIEEICTALEITLADFFCCDVFRNIDRE